MKAKISIVYQHKSVVAIRDLNDGSKSVTNDAEAVVAFLIERGEVYETTHLIYCDTEGNWDELVHNGKEFVGYNYLGTKSLYAAIGKVLNSNVRFVVSLTNEIQGIASEIIYAGGDYQEAFDKACEARSKPELRNKWIKFSQDGKDKWAKIS